MAIGDSKTAAVPGWVSKLVVDLNLTTSYAWSETPSRIGVGGLDMSTNPTGLRYRIDADIAAMKGTPNEILINMGANDLSTIGDGATWKTDYTYVVNALHAAFPSADIRLTKVWKASSDAAIAIANAKIDEMYAANAWLKTGINENFLEGGDNGATYTSDGTHPTEPVGYQLEADAWKTALGY